MLNLWLVQNIILGLWTGVEPSRIARSRKATAPLSKIFLERAARMELRWCYTEFPTQASAQEADMSLLDYQDFVYNAGLLDVPDPVAAWIKEGKRQWELINWLSGKDRVSIKGSSLIWIYRFAIGNLKRQMENITFRMERFSLDQLKTQQMVGCGLATRNLWWQEVIDVELWFEDGKVVKEKASKGRIYWPRC